MFNKPSVFGRTESTPRRDALGSAAANAPSAVSLSERNTSRNQIARESATPGASPTSPNSISARALTSATPVANVVADNSIPVLEKEQVACETPTGARLIVGPEVKLKGAEILDCDTLVVEGRVEATMDSRVIRIAENGSFSGKVSIDIAEVYGNFDGELIARSQLIIHSTGRVSGTIRYGKLVADEGGELCGDIGVISANSAAAKTHANSNASSAAPVLGVAVG